MYELIEIYMGQASIVDSFVLLSDCLMVAIREDYIADGMATFICGVQA